MAASFSIMEAGLVGLFMESVAYGVFVVSLAWCLRALLCHEDRLIVKSSRQIRWWAVVITVLMAVIATADVAINLRLCLSGFVWNDNAAVLFDDTSNWMNIMGYVDYIAQTAIGDAILIYRLYVVYGKKWTVIVAPLMIFISGMTCAFLVLGLGLARNDLGGWDFAPLMIVSFSLTVILNILATSLIILKLWRAHSRISQFSSTSARFLTIIRIVLDSGLLYTASVLVLVGTLPLNNVSGPVSATTIQVIGICFNLIIIRVHATTQQHTREAEEHVVPIPSQGTGTVKLSAGSDNLDSLSLPHIGIDANARITLHHPRLAHTGPSPYDTDHSRGSRFSMDA
ncbi:hypothetical protein NM688_g3313 [Phlebia brevispora]|uniref:Uncharacterized protein n=1 Tax=Phlebia brevispora TaxID=194682 RepID=A0ACC1T5V2_9APHY|nr:hypothetical protein NM688_g3313 [Phlebia brevispora]